MVDIRQSVRYGSYLNRIGWKVERVEGINYFIKTFPIIGSVIKVQRPGKLKITTIEELSRKYRTFQIIVEPKNQNQASQIKNSGYKLSKSPFLPSKTLQIDLTRSKKSIFGNFKKDARYAVKRGEGNNIKSYSTPIEIKRWREAWKNSVNFRRYVPSARQLINLRKSFPSNHSLFLASHNISGSIIGGALFTRSSHDYAYYWYGFTNREGRTSLSQYSLLHYGILWAKEIGCKIFDFEGIYDERFPIDSWRGFTHFKKSFGGTEVLYPGAFTKFTGFSNIFRLG